MSSYPQAPRPASSGGASTGRIVVWLCVLGLMFWPRLFIVVFAIFSNLIGRAFSGAFVVIVGFLLLPWTTLAYALMWSIGSDQVNGWEWIVVGFALIVDFGTWLVGKSSLQR
jgi:hypothetical protein